MAVVIHNVKIGIKLKMPTKYLTKVKTPVSDLILEDSSVIFILEKFNINYHCEGEKTLEEHLQKLDIPINSFSSSAISQEKKTISLPKNLDDANQVIDFIIEKYHKQLSTIFSNLADQLTWVLSKLSNPPDHLILFQKLIKALGQELVNHIWKEENILFPIIRQLQDAYTKNSPMPDFHCGSINNPISQMEHEHNAADLTLNRMGQIITGYIANVQDEDHKKLCQQFDLLKFELHKHIHLENYVLHPLSIELENNFKHNLE